jgi:chemotaxis protein methyltransferase CheR
MIKITVDEFRMISRYIYSISGIFLDETKTYLVETRLTSLLHQLGCSSFTEFLHRVELDGSRSLEREIINSIVTQETHFFRDDSPFDLLQYKILPDLIDRKKLRCSGFFPVNINIWNAGCSTGQEVYSVAMVVKEMLAPHESYNVRILGTDISDRAVSRASYGQYNKFEIQRGLSEDRLHRYFAVSEDGWRIRDDIRAMVTFRKHNLMDSFAGLGPFDVIFCRNVAIYLTARDRANLFEKIASVLDVDGYLIVGSTESLTTISTRFEPKKYIRSIFYQLRS